MTSANTPFRMTIAEIVKPETLVAPDISKDDFMRALSKIRPTVSPQDLVRQDQFTKDFGQEG